MSTKTIPQLLALTLALFSGSCVVTWGDWGKEPNFVRFESSEPLEGDQVLDAEVEMNVGKLEVELGEADTLYSLEAYYDSNAFQPDLEFDRGEGRARLDFQLEGRNRRVHRIEKNRLTLRISPRVQVRLRAETGVAESEIDLTGMQLASLRLEAGVGETRLAMLTPNPVPSGEIRISNGVGALEATGLGNFGFQRLIFEGGVGGAELDFSGAWEREGEVHIEVGVGGIQLRFPRDLGVELTASNSLFTSLDVRGFDKSGGSYLSKNYDRATRKVRVSVEGGIGGVDIDWM